MAVASTPRVAAPRVAMRWQPWCRDVQRGGPDDSGLYICGRKIRVARTVDLPIGYICIVVFWIRGENSTVGEKL